MPPGSNPPQPVLGADPDAGTLVVAILRKLAESEALLHIGPTAFELVSHDTEQVAIAIRIDVASFPLMR